MFMVSVPVQQTISFSSYRSILYRPEAAISWLALRQIGAQTKKNKIKITRKNHRHSLKLLDATEPREEGTSCWIWSSCEKLLTLQLTNKINLVGICFLYMTQLKKLLICQWVFFGIHENWLSGFCCFVTDTELPHKKFPQLKVKSFSLHLANNQNVKNLLYNPKKRD